MQIAQFQAENEQKAADKAKMREDMLGYQFYLKQRKSEEAYAKLSI